MLFGLLPAHALAASPPSLNVPTGLSIAEIKITGNEFILIQNSGTTTIDLSRYWFYAFNNVNPLSSGVSSSSQQLPAAPLSSGQTLLLSAGGGQTCGAAVAAKLSISLTDSGGFLELVQSSFSGNSLLQTPVDSVSWSTGTNSATGQISNLPSSSADPASAYYRYQNPDSSSVAPYLWQVADIDSSNACQLNVKAGGSVMPGPLNPGGQYLTGPAPPVSFASQQDSSFVIADGLAAPIINELLPNPAAPQGDAEDEFIELYNPNDSDFDLSGFKLQTGTTTLHSYAFVSGTYLPAKSFAAFYSIDTNLSLSNSAGQGRLLDPQGNLISQSDTYSNAKEGQAWALANGQWYWTTTPTPAQANLITQPAAVTAAAKTTATKKTSAAKNPTGKVKSASTTAPANSSIQNSNNSAKLHPLVLAAVGAGAVAYAAYEYRHDMANRFYQLRRYREARVAAGSSSATADGSGAGGRFGWWQDYLRPWLGSRLRRR